MGTFYLFYAEAKVKGRWRGIDFYVRGKDGKMVPVPLFEGKSIAASMIDWSGMETQISASSMSPELITDHGWLFKDDDGEFMKRWREQCVRCMDGSDIAAKDVSSPEYGGFVSRDRILKFKRKDIDEIDDWLTPEDFAKLPDDVRKGYDWFEWTEPYGDQENFALLKRELARRVQAYNDARWSWPFDEAPDEISMSDTRVVIIIS